MTALVAISIWLAAPVLALAIYDARPHRWRLTRPIVTRIFVLAIGPLILLPIVIAAVQHLREGGRP